MTRQPTTRLPSYGAREGSSARFGAWTVECTVLRCWAEIDRPCVMRRDAGDHRQGDARPYPHPMIPIAVLTAIHFAPMVPPSTVLVAPRGVDEPERGKA